MGARSVSEAVLDLVLDLRFLATAGHRGRRVPVAVGDAILHVDGSAHNARRKAARSSRNWSTLSLLSMRSCSSATGVAVLFVIFAVILRSPVGSSSELQTTVVLPFCVRAAISRETDGHAY